MFKQTFQHRAIVFFCALGWICNASALGDDGQVSTFQPVVHEPEVTQDIAEVGTDQTLPDGQTVAIGSLGLIDLHVKDLDVTMVLQLLSLEAKRNIIATRNVSGTVSADLYGVDFYEALDAVLHANGYGYEEKNNFIYVYTSDELEARRAATQKPVTRIHRLNYITAADAAQFASPLLSAAGSISVSGAATPGFQASIGAGGENSHAHGETLVIRDLAENVEEITAVLRELDVRPKQVQVAATILEARLTELNAFGVDINAIIDFDMANFGSPLGVVDQILEEGVGPVPGDRGQAVQTTVGNTGSGPSGIKIGLLSSNVQAFIRALDSVTDTTVIAKPTLMALNRQRADLLVGERLGYLSTTATDTSTTQTVEFLDVGTQLSFRAFISDDDFVRLELRPSVSEGSTSVIEGMVIPNTTTNELVTNVMVRSGQTVVLGGLFKESTDVSRQQVPGLGDVPLLGWGFRGQDDEIRRSEVIFLITPTVVKDETKYAEADRVAESVELARMGSKKALLPWSRSKQTASYLRKANEYHREGRTDKALWNVNMALTLEPTFVEALRLKAELTGEKLYLPDRSLLHDAVNHMIDERSGSLPQEETSDEQALLDDEQMHDSTAGDADTIAETDVDAEEASVLNVEDVLQWNSEADAATVSAPVQDE